MFLNPSEQYVSFCRTYRDIATETLERLLATKTSTLLAGCDATRLLAQLRAAQDLATSTTLGFLAAKITDPDVIELIALADWLLDRSKPAHHDALGKRQIGILRHATGAAAGYPYFAPETREGEVVGLLKDERAYCVVPEQTYTILDHDGEPVDVRGPVPDMGDDRVSAERFRAYYQLYSGLSVFYKGCEVLTPASRKRAWRDWPFPTRIPGVIGAGGKTRCMISMRVFLPVHHFGAFAEGEIALRDTLGDSFAPPSASLPSAAQILSAVLQLPGEVRP